MVTSDLPGVYFKMQVFLINKRRIRKTWKRLPCPEAACNPHHKSSSRNRMEEGIKQGIYKNIFHATWESPCVSSSWGKYQMPYPATSPAWPGSPHLQTHLPISLTVPRALCSSQIAESPFSLLTQDFHTCYSCSLKYFSLHSLSS